MSSSYTRFVERESTHAVFRKHVIIPMRTAQSPVEQARMVSTAMSLANVARSFDPAFDVRADPGKTGEILLEFELNFPDRFATAVNEWIAEEVKKEPAILEVLAPAHR